MGTNSKYSHATQMAADQALIDGLTKHAATLATLLIGGQTVHSSDIVLALQARIAAIRAAIAAQAAAMVAVADARAELAKSKMLVAGARQVLKVAFAGQADQLGDFGLTLPKVPTPLTTEQKARAAAKAKATYAANHPNARGRGKAPAIPTTP